MTEMSKAAMGGVADLTKCSTKFTPAFTKAETKAGAGVCPTEGDVSAVESAIDADTIALQAKLRGVRFVDNGDDTVTDNQTGLQWEKKDTAVGSGVNLANAHDVDNRYVWSNSGTAPDGPAFTDFLGTLNNCVSVDHTTVTGGFAGHCDWRLPTIQEVRSIVDVTQGTCVGGSGGCIDPIFGPTANFYWSATTFASSPGSAWWVHTNNAPDIDGKTFNYHVRAVRSGS